MEVRVAATAGFCFGVKRAVDTIYEAVEEGGRVYSLGPVIHNDTVVAELKERGVEVIEGEGELRALASSGALCGATIVIRAHGVEQETEDLLSSLAPRVRIRDATCPLVKKVQLAAREHAEAGELVIITGDPLHPEVRGILSRAGERAMVVGGPDEAGLKELDPEVPACIVSQTTFDITKFHEIVEILKKRIYHVNVVDTVCSATRLRQKEAEEMSLISDMMIVIGGRNSSNTRKLYDICSGNCQRTQYIGSLADLDISALSKVGSVGITAGASTPYKTIEEVLRYVREF